MIKLVTGGIGKMPFMRTSKILSFLFYSDVQFFQIVLSVYARLKNKTFCIFVFV
jgi:hypothetical protein